MKIFVASTGRCGTYFMSEIFQKLTSIPSFHEPQPWCAGQTLEEVNNSIGFLSYKTIEELNEKITQVKADTRDGWYFESNQIFIKSYIRPMLENFAGEIGCIYLHRNPIETIISYQKKNPRRDGAWKLRSHWKKNILRTEEILSFHENNLWQCLEIRERFLKYRQRFTKVFDFDFKDLNKAHVWKLLFNQFGIQHMPFTEIPMAGKNEIIADKNTILEKIIETWDSPIEKPTRPDQEGYRKERFIENAKKTISLNLTEMNQHETG